MSAKFKVGQVLMYDRHNGKPPIPFLVKEIVDGPEDTGYFYQFDRKNCLAEHMVRELTAEEKGEGRTP